MYSHGGSNQYTTHIRDFPVQIYNVKFYMNIRFTVGGGMCDFSLKKIYDRVFGSVYNCSGELHVLGISYVSTNFNIKKVSKY